MVKRAEDQDVRRDHHAKGGTPIGASKSSGGAVDPQKNPPKNLIQKTTQSSTYVAYYRVSTRQQDDSGLGIEAQQKAVRTFINHNGNQIIAEFVEIESRSNNKRPELQEAIQLVKEYDATLVVAKIDRLTSSMTLLETLENSKVRFKAADMPEADETMVGMMVLFAKRELRLVSERTKAALDAKREREPDWKPGMNNFTQAGRDKAIAKIRDNAKNHKANRFAYHFICPRRVDGMSYDRIAQELNREGYLTRGGKPFHAQTVKNIWLRFTDEEKPTSNKSK